MIEAGGGSIVNISLCSSMGAANLVAYSASKSALIAMTRCLAEDHKARADTRQRDPSRADPLRHDRGTCRTSCLVWCEQNGVQGRLGRRATSPTRSRFWYRTKRRRSVVPSCGSITGRRCSAEGDHGSRQDRRIRRRALPGAARALHGRAAHRARAGDHRRRRLPHPARHRRTASSSARASSTSARRSA